MKRPRAVITGIGEADGGRASGRPGVELGAEAALRALTDAEVSIDDVDGLLVEDPDTDQHHMAHLALADLLGMQPKFAMATACGGATPVANLAVACAAIEAGLAKRILVVDYDARQTLRQGDPAKRLARTGGHTNPWEDPYGPVTMTKFALVERAHMHRFGTTREQLAHTTVNARRNGALRSNAQMRTEVTVEDVLASPPIAEPIHLLDCALISDWGSAFIVSKHNANRDRDVDVLGFGQGHQGYAITRASSLTEFPGIEQSGKAAFSMTSARPSDIDVALIYDSFTITVLIALENLGFCALGEGGKLVASGELGPTGALPLNPHGGQLSYSGGHGHFITEAVRQLRGEASSGQVSGAELALCQGTAAGVLSSYTALLGNSS
ncbi:MAG: thiolase family protein [Acidimicrobiia bacterium]